MWAVEAVAPVLPSLLFLGFRAAFLVLLLAGAWVLLPAGAMVLLLPAGAMVLLLPAGVLVLLLTVAALLPEDFLAVPEAEAAAGPPLLGPLASDLPCPTQTAAQVAGATAARGIRTL